jgi:trehalose-6-phosphate synthase
VDFDEFAHGASSPEVRKRARRDRAAMWGTRPASSSVSIASDYTKGIIERPWPAYRHFLDLFPEMRRKRGPLVQVVVPSREDIPQNMPSLKAETREGWSARSTAHYGRAPDGFPIHYIHRSLDRAEFAGLLPSGRTLPWFTPLKDGMNLVAKGVLRPAE